MTEKEKKEILKLSQQFFRETIVFNHAAKLPNLTKISHYKYNPFLIKYLAKFFAGNDKPKSIAKILLYPRILGTSLNTSFGSNLQKFCSKVLGKYGSTTSGIDIEFSDATDKRKKYCQVKSGPTTINKDDVDTIDNHFSKIKRLARTNHLDVRVNDLIIGVLYGNPEDLSGNYKEVNKKYQVIIGKDFWHRLTGDKTFYADLIVAFGKEADKINGKSQLKKTLKKLTKDIEDNLNFV